MNTHALFSSISPRYVELSGRVALITGSARRIGQAIAIRLAREGMRVVVHSNVPEEGGATASELRALGVTALPVTAEVGNTAGIQHLFEATLEAFGTVDVLVNNAALLQRASFFEVDEGLLDQELAVNVRGAYLCARRAAEVMRLAGRGSIINISSVGGLRAHWRGLPYDVTKGALDAMTRAMALELGPLGIRVNAAAPGATQRLDAPNSLSSDVARRGPLGRAGSPFETAAAVAFLASNEASYITGQVLYVDGGITAQLHPPGQPI